MKKLIASICIASLCPLGLSAAEYADVKNQAKSADFELSHTVARVSYFKTIVSNSLIDEAGKTKLGRFIVRNNTRDGFTLTLESENNGVMHTESTDDGEVDIPYGVSLAKDGDIGEGINNVLSFSAADLAGAVTILEKAGDTVSGPTDAEFTLSVDITDDSNIMGMAGTYTDTLTLTYTDL